MYHDTKNSALTWINITKNTVHKRNNLKMLQIFSSSVSFAVALAGILTLNSRPKSFCNNLYKNVFLCILQCVIIYSFLFLNENWLQPLGATVVSLSGTCWSHCSLRLILKKSPGSISPLGRCYSSPHVKMTSSLNPSIFPFTL